MAGSLKHVLHGWSLIENMGDAHECVEELLWLVVKYIGPEIAEQHLEHLFYPMIRGELPQDAAIEFVKDRMST
jgi:hypothetical protein